MTNDGGSPVVVEPRKTGRPRASEPRSAVMTWLPVSQHDRLIRIAKAQDVSVSEIVRRSVTRLLIHRGSGG